MVEIFEGNSYVVRRKILKLVGASFHIFDSNNNVIMYSNQKGFKLKEDIRIYTGEDMTDELLTIKARNIIDISPTFDVVDPKTGEKLGALKRKGMKSILKDEWIILSTNDEEIGSIQEDSMLMALLRRFIIQYIPQEYNGYIKDTKVCTFKQNLNPLVTKITVEFVPSTDQLLDKRLGLAAAILLCAIEGKQQ